MQVAALEVYVRRAYTAYEVQSVQHDELEGGIPIVQWQFLLPSSHPNRLDQSHRNRLDQLQKRVLKGFLNRSDTFLNRFLNMSDRFQTGT